MANERRSNKACAARYDYLSGCHALLNLLFNISGKPRLLPLQVAIEDSCVRWAVISVPASDRLKMGCAARNSPAGCLAAIFTGLLAIKPLDDFQ